MDDETEKDLLVGEGWMDEGWKEDETEKDLLVGEGEEELVLDYRRRRHPRRWGTEGPTTRFRLITKISAGITKKGKEGITKKGKEGITKKGRRKSGSGLR